MTIYLHFTSPAKPNTGYNVEIDLPEGKLEKIL